MNRRELLRQSSGLGLAAALAQVGGVALARTAVPAAATGAQGVGASSPPLSPPVKGSIPVAFVLAKHAVVIDFAGPWEVFQDVNVPSRTEPAFSLFTVAETLDPVAVSGGMMILPNYSFATAPAAKIVVIPALHEPTERLLAWILSASRETDITMSVCTGASVLAATGLLSGRSATTHHSAYREMAMDYADITVKRGVRYVEDGKYASSGGLSSGIDLALHIVERYFGRDVATQTAFDMEYQGRGWLDANSNRVYAQPRLSAGRTLCPICSMDVDRKTAVSSAYKGQTYYFCMPQHKERFDAAPQRWTAGA